MGKHLVFTGIKPPQRTWFETRVSESITETLTYQAGEPIPDAVVHDFPELRTDTTRAVVAPMGGYVAASDFELQRVETVGGDVVTAYPGQSFPLQYVSDEHASYHIAKGNARIIDIPDPPAESEIPAAAPEPTEPKARTRPGRAGKE